MPRAFSEGEASTIREQLRKEGFRLFAARGVTRTSVEQITRSVGIAKGYFYKSYASKELLFFELLEDAQNDVRAPLIEGSASAEVKTRENL